VNSVIDASRTMTTLIMRVRAIWIAVVLLGGAGIVASMVPAHAAQQSGARGQPDSESVRARQVDAQISRLKQKLRITEAQMPQWNALAAGMRENARRIRLSRADRAKIHPTNVIDELYADRRETQARLGRLERIIPLAEALYAVLDPGQKALADALFGGIRRHHEAVLATQ
jgi:LTXXQ motif family protein